MFLIELKLCFFSFKVSFVINKPAKIGFASIFYGLGLPD